jgi:hypothetical protein
MILNANAETALRTVMTIFAAFWVTVLIVLFIAVGLLIRKRERALESRKHAGH